MQNVLILLCIWWTCACARAYEDAKSAKKITNFAINYYLIQNRLSLHLFSRMQLSHTQITNFVFSIHSALELKQDNTIEKFKMLKLKDCFCCSLETGGFILTAINFIDTLLLAISACNDHAIFDMPNVPEKCEYTSDRYYRWIMRHEMKT